MAQGQTRPPTSWQLLKEAIVLYRQRRQHAARALWGELPQPFRNAVLRYVLEISQSPEAAGTCPQVVMGSPYGEFSLGPEVLAELLEVVPHLVLR